MSIELPYALTEQEIRAAIEQVELYFVKLNEATTAAALPSLCDVLAPNALSGMVSELMVTSLGVKCSGLTKNSKIGGFPDLIPRQTYSDDSVQKGCLGIEVKASKRAAWQGHNSEEGWFLAIQYTRSEQDNRIIIDALHLAYLALEDWTFCPRKENSRRTPTASINKSGLKKLRNSVIYKNGVYHGLERRLEQACQNAPDSVEDPRGCNMVS